MTAFEVMKKAICEKQDLDAIDVWNSELSKEDYEKIAPRMGLTAKEVKIFAEAKGLELLLKVHNNILEKQKKYAVENALGERFAKDVTAQGFPWSQVEKTRDEIDDELWNRRLKIINLLFNLVKRELMLKKISREEKIRIAKLPKMQSGGKRKTLAMHRTEAKKLLKRKKR